MHTNRELIKIMRLVIDYFVVFDIAEFIADQEQAEALARWIKNRFEVRLPAQKLIGKNAQGVSELILGNSKKREEAEHDHPNPTGS